MDRLWPLLPPIRLLLLLVLLLLPFSFAQVTVEDAPNSSLAVSPITTSHSKAPTTFVSATRSEDARPSVHPSLTDAIPTQPTLFEAPAPTSDSGSPGTDENDDDNGRTGIVNYYFLLLAVFVVVIILICLLWSRSRRKRRAQHQDLRQDALHRDVNRLGGHWWMHVRRDNREEGLNERGEAPPPYIPNEPVPVFRPDAPERQSPAVPLQNLSTNQQKPPDYSVNSTLDG